MGIFLSISQFSTTKTLLKEKQLPWPIFPTDSVYTQHRLLICCLPPHTYWFFLLLCLIPTHTSSVRDVWSHTHGFFNYSSPPPTFTWNCFHRCTITTSYEVKMIIFKVSYFHCPSLSDKSELLLVKSTVNRLISIFIILQCNVMPIWNVTYHTHYNVSKHLLCCTSISFFPCKSSVCVAFFKRNTLSVLLSFYIYLYLKKINHYN